MDLNIDILLTVFESFYETVAPFAADESNGSITDVLSSNMDAAGEMVKEKTKQVGVFFVITVIPIALIIIGFVLKILYDMYTGAADKVAEGVKAGSSIIKDASSKLKAAVINKEIADDEDEDEPPPKKEVKKLLFGEILRKYVLPSITESEIKEALGIQKSSKQVKKVGEILGDSGKITKAEIAHVLKIQQKMAR